MAKVKGPILSLSARGQIAQSQVYASWRGVDYARRYVVPANPNTAEQAKTRDVFRWGEETWKRVGALGRAPWDLFAKGRPFVGRNAFVGQNITAMRGDADTADFVGSPGANGGLPHASLVLADVGVGGGLKGTFTVPTAPVGWTLEAAVLVAFKTGAITALVTEFVEDEDLAAPWEVTLVPSVLDVAYTAAGWLRWLKPDSSLAYGPSTVGQVTPTS